MTIYLGIDDTDTIDSRGTGRLARDIAAGLSSTYQVYGVTRHQLYVHEDIPFTSHNSCAVIHINACGEDAAVGIFETAKQMILDDFIEGSDPGVAVADETQVSAALIAYGTDARSTILTQERARALAKNLGIRLEGLGGTEDGVIGSLAGVGLAATGNDGRFLMKGRIREIREPTPVSELLESGIDAVISLDGRPVSKGIIHMPGNKSPKPCPINGKAVLFVDEKDGIFTAVKRN